MLFSEYSFLRVLGLHEQASLGRGTAASLQLQASVQREVQICIPAEVRFGKQTNSKTVERVRTK